MAEFNRRTLMKAAGASLLGHTVTTTVAGASPDNAGVSFLEASLSFDFGDVENLERNHSDGPSKYAVNPNQGTLEVRTVTDEEANALATGNRLVNFRGIKSSVDSIGGVNVPSLFSQDDVGKTRSTYVYASDGYEMPILDINWDARRLTQLLTSDQTKGMSVKEGFLRLRLPSQEVTVRKKIVRDEFVEDDDLPEWKKSKVIDRPTARVEVDPYLTVAFHPNLDVLSID